MRTGLTILPILQTLFVSALSPGLHVHARGFGHDVLACRPHIHLHGRVQNSSVAHGDHHDQGAEHHHHGQTAGRDPSTPREDHDRDAVYVTQMTLAVPPCRGLTPEQLPGGWPCLVPAKFRESDQYLEIASLATGPPDRRPSQFGRLPHILRI